MKKALLILLVLSCLLLFGCGKAETQPTTDAPTTTTGIPTATVTFPEGFTVVQIAERLEKKGICSADEFIRLINDEAFVMSLGYTFTEFVPQAQRAFLLEGYLFPDTYEFYLGDSAENVLKKILRNTSAKLTGEYTLRAKELGFTLDEIITLASIIQEEAYTDESMKLISSVLHNRMESPSYRRLQCDVTIHYVNDYITGSPYLTEDTEKYKELYNTYKCIGLPEGPISCPGAAAIEAALYPEESNYYYFVTDEDWNYYFNESWAGHVKKCKELGLM